LTEVVGLRVFIHAPHGGNPVPLVADASGMSDAQMQDVARRYGHESAFVLPADDPRADWRFRFFVPQHEMEMCGHATVGTLWALRRWGRWTRPGAVVQTLSGLVDAQWDAPRERVWISQPRVTWVGLTDANRQRVAHALGLDASMPLPAMVNASTSRAKTLVELGSIEQLQALSPDLAAMEGVCEAIGSTGLYPYASDASEAASGPATLFARQFPKSSGYPEDAATGIAAAALWGYLEDTSRIAVGTPHAPVTSIVRQGDAMGKPSAIELRARFATGPEVQGCWLSGRVDWTSL
jgi:PhzF family phenazine biosynthesis protein